LRKAGLVTDRKDGLWFYYQVNSVVPLWALDVIRKTADEIQRHQPYASDAQALKAPTTNPNHP